MTLDEDNKVLLRAHISTYFYVHNILVFV